MDAPTKLVRPVEVEACGQYRLYLRLTDMAPETLPALHV